ncbi:MAG: 5'/3'-nucleotidase SurE [Pseudoflavonifractor sp.]|nr:5'/3'-nucleotidase SurE [Alloprevotella sp.]MCM1117184.1 5'/3'-nucleotidase SurE [Pseudoflavonifractor sp.]
MIILVSNDDGYAAKGLDALLSFIAPVAAEFGASVMVMAPDGPRSGFSSAITHDGPIKLRHLPPHQSGAEMTAVGGTPTDCIKLGIHLLKERGLRPALILSGINHGSNSAVSVTYSGTMACAIEGATNGIPAIGFSLLDWSADADFSVCRSTVAEVTRRVLANGLPDRLCLNVNIPSGAEPKGMKTVRGARGFWTEEYQGYTDPHGRPFYWLTGHFHNIEPLNEETDEYWLARGWATVVPVPADMDASGADMASVKKLLSRGGSIF